MRLAALDEKAAAIGLSRGMALADARAIFPSLEVLAEDPQADQALLEAIADWCDRYTPLVALDGADGLVLDITGCAGLFGGEAPLLADMLAKLCHQGFAATAAIAATPGAAFAIARFAPLQRLENAVHDGSGPVLGADRTAAALAPLPLAALRLDGEMLAALARLGLRRIGDIMARPRAPLARRFGRGLLLRLDQALGAVEEAISPRLPAPVHIAERHLPAAIARIEDIEWLVDRLARTLCSALERSGEGARRLELSLFRVDGVVARAAVGSSRPLRDPVAIAALFHERLAALHDDFDPGCGFDWVRLAVIASEPLDPADTSFLAGAGVPAGAVDAVAANLADRLAARLGGNNVLRAVARDTHWPGDDEVLQRAAAAASSNCQAQAEPSQIPPLRPVRLFERPEPLEALAQVPDGPPVRFRWRRMLHEVAGAEGPERIAGEWWRGREAIRDYYRVEDDRGRRFWLFRQGLYGDAQPPRWFLHGLFA